MNKPYTQKPITRPRQAYCRASTARVTEISRLMGGMCSRGTDLLEKSSTSRYSGDPDVSGHTVEWAVSQPRDKEGDVSKIAEVIGL